VIQRQGADELAGGNDSPSPERVRFRAKLGYDLASGLGVPQFAAVASALGQPAR